MCTFVMTFRPSVASTWWSWIVPVMLLWSIPAAAAERVWDDELKRFLTPEEMAQEDVYLTEVEAAKLMFPDSDEIKEETLTLTPEEKKTIEARIGWDFKEPSFKVFIGLSKTEADVQNGQDRVSQAASDPAQNGQGPVNGAERTLHAKNGYRIDGYAVLQHTIGKHKPFTYMTGVDLDGEVINVEVLVYRESRGSEVRKDRFNYQYEGKTVYDPIRINRDIIHVSGATMSVRSMSAGVKRALVLVDECYLKPKGLGSDATASKPKEKGFLEVLFGF